MGRLQAGRRATRESPLRWGCVGAWVPACAGTTNRGGGRRTRVRAAWGQGRGLAGGCARGWRQGFWAPAFAGETVGWRQGCSGGRRMAGVPPLAGRAVREPPLRVRGSGVMGSVGGGGSGHRLSPVKRWSGGRGCRGGRRMAGVPPPAGRAVREPPLRMRGSGVMGTVGGGGSKHRLSPVKRWGGDGAPFDRLRADLPRLPGFLPAQERRAHRERGPVAAPFQSADPSPWKRTRPSPPEMEP